MLYVNLYIYSFLDVFRKLITPVLQSVIFNPPCYHATKSVKRSRAKKNGYFSGAPFLNFPLLLLHRVF